MSLPVLLLAGLSPQAAVAVGRVGLLGLTISGAYKFIKEGKVLWKYVLPLSLISITGSVIGTHMLIAITSRYLNILIGVLVVMTLPLLYVKKPQGIAKKAVTKARWYFCLAVYLVIRTYAGLFGGGAGTIEFISLVHWADLNLVEANGVTRIPSLIGAAISVTMLSKSGLLNPTISLTLFVSMLIGGYIGSHIAIKKGADWSKHLVAVMIIIVATKLIFF
ncbi:MAG: sulfite exporter TauE/SafE family protein [Patescibacteria group bacterium]